MHAVVAVTRTGTARPLDRDIAGAPRCYHATASDGHAVVLLTRPRAAPLPGHRHVTTTRRDLRVCVKHNHARAEETRIGTARPLDRDLAGAPRRHHAPESDSHAVVFATRTGTARPLNRDLAGAPRRHHAAGFDTHTDVGSTRPGAAPLPGHRHVATTRRNLRARATHVHAPVKGPRTSTASPLDRVHARCATTDLAATLHSHAKLATGRVVAALSLDGDDAGSGRLNNGIVDVDSDEVTRRRRYLLVGFQRDPTIDRGDARTAAERDVLRRLGGQRVRTGESGRPVEGDRPRSGSVQHHREIVRIGVGHAVVERHRSPRAAIHDVDRVVVRQTGRLQGNRRFTKLHKICGCEDS